MIKETISAVLIIKNDASSIEKAILSLVSKVDEIVICDTGSTDGSVEVEKKYESKKVRIVNFSWDDDFSSARNYAWSFATKKWIIWIDGDEELLTSKKNIQSEFHKLSNKSRSIANLKIINPDQKQFVLTTRIIINNKKNYKYFGLIHEEIRLNGEEIPSSDIVDLNIEIEHTGYDPQVMTTKHKVDRNIKMLVKMHGIEKENPRWNYFLSRDGAGKISTDYLIRLCQDGIKKNNDAYQIGLYQNLIRLYLNKGAFQSAKRIIRVLKKEYPECIDYFYFEYLIKIQQNRIYQSEMLSQIIEKREEFFNDKKSYSLINDSGFHIDSLIGYLLFYTDDYKMAKKYNKLLKDNNFPGLLDYNQVELLNDFEE